MDNKFSMSNEECLQFLTESDFGTIVTSNFSISHLPYIVDENKYIYFHVANSNCLTNISLDDKFLFLIIGPHGLVETCCYTKNPSVPTWNYIAVNFTGHIEVIDNDYKKKKVMLASLKRFQPSLIKDKTTMPDSVFSNLLDGITVLRFKIESMNGIAKLSQNRSTLERKNIIDHFTLSDNEALASLMKNWYQSGK